MSLEERNIVAHGKFIERIKFYCGRKRSGTLH